MNLNKAKSYLYLLLPLVFIAACCLGLGTDSTESATRAVAADCLLGPAIAGFCLAMVAESPENTPPEPLPTKNIRQVGIVVPDVEKAAKAWAQLLGVEPPKPSITDTRDKTNATYHGRPTDARAKLAFFELDNLQLELIEPVGEPSTWHDYLKANGPGIHHIAFEIKDMDQKLDLLEKHGFKTIQRGDYTGGRYAYAEATKQLGTVIELLENY